MLLLGGAGSPPSPPVFGIGTPTYSEHNGSYYTFVPLHNLSTPSANSVGVTLNANNASLPVLFPAELPWLNNSLCGGPAAGAGPRGTAWTYNVTTCESVPGYWYAAAVDPEGAVRDLYLSDVSSPTAVFASPSWSSSGPPYADLYPGDHLVLITSQPLQGTGTLLQVFLGGNLVSTRLSVDSPPLPILEEGNVAQVLPCPPTTSGGSVSLGSANLTWSVSQPVALSQIDLQVQPATFSLAALPPSAIASCPLLTGGTAGSPRWTAELWVKGGWVASYAPGPGGGTWVSASAGNGLPELYPQEPITLVLYGGPGLVEVAPEHAISVSGTGGLVLESYGGALTNSWGVVLT